MRAGSKGGRGEGGNEQFSTLQRRDIGVCGAGGVLVGAGVDAGVLVGVAANLCGWQPLGQSLSCKLLKIHPQLYPPLGAQEITLSLEIHIEQICWMS